MAKSSKLTAGRKSYEPLSVESSAACCCWAKPKRGSGLVDVGSFLVGGRSGRFSRTALPLATLCTVSTFRPIHIESARPPYLCLWKSCGGPRGPWGTFAVRLCEPSGLWPGSPGRVVAETALEALVLRSRLPLSPVFWNLRTRSSACVSTLVAHAAQRGGTCRAARVLGHVRA